MAEEENFDLVATRSIPRQPRLHVDLELVAREAEVALFQTRANGEMPGSAAEDAVVNLGRFVLQRKLGEGGMGVVYQAYDEKLSRSVAIKVAFTHPDHALSERRRLHREATALAQLSHPNVVHVYEVGDAAGQVFFVMELVEGTNARRWLRARARSMKEVLDVFEQAGRGLAAAHAVGIVHRDFKPANIVVGDDGRVRVVDFGLATDDLRFLSESGTTGVHTTGEGSVEESAPSHGSGRRLLESTMAVGSIVGTLPYMSPEQHDGRPADARSDQFSFCAALYEGLFGVRPFAGSGARELRASKYEGELVRPVRTAGISLRVRKAVQRGLKADPDERFASMDELLAELRIDAGKRGRRWLRQMGVASGVVLALWAGWRSSFEDAALQLSPCTESERLVADVITMLDDGALRSAFEATKMPLAADSAERTETRLRDFADAWVREHTEACRATRVHLEQTEALLEQRMACLSSARRRLRAAVGVFLDADEEVVIRSHRVLATLPDLERCSDLEALEEETERPLEQQAVVEEAREQLALAEALDAVGRYETSSEAIARARRVLEGMEASAEWIAVMIRHGINLDERGASEEAAAALREALRLAIGTERSELAFDAVQQLIKLESDELGEYETAAAHVELAEALLIANGDRPRDIVRFLDARSRLRFARAEYEAALEDEQRAVELVDPNINPMQASSVAEAMGRSLMALGRSSGAEAEFRRAMEIRRAHLGPDHPRHAHSYNAIGNVLYLRGEFEAAASELERGLELRVRALGPDHRIVSESHNNLGAVLIELGRLERAEHHLHRALEIRERHYGDQHPTIANSRDNLAVVLLALGRFEDAIAEHRRALAIRTRTQGPEHPKLGTSHHGIAMVYHQMGRLEDAEREYRRAIELLEGGRGAEHPETVTGKQNLAEVLLDAERYLEATELLESVWVLRQREGTPVYQVAETALSLASARLEMERGEVQELLDRARVALELEPHPQREELLRELQAKVSSKRGN